MPKYYELDSVRNSLEEYTIHEHIDSGGFKDVFLAERGSEMVVVKLLPIERSSKRRRAKREAEAMTKISSPNFVELLDYFELQIEGKPTFLIEEEYIDGPTLSEKIGQGRYGLDFGFQVTEALLDLLIQFDDLNIIHRDIKPNNIMIDGEGEVILLDVGIVRFEERESVTPDHADRLGTPNYGAPEQLDYNKSLQSIRTDIFSTGIVMFESITGQHPYSNSSKSVSEAIMDGEKAKMKDILEDDEIAEELDELFNVMTQPKPYARYRSPEFAKEKFDEIKELV